MFGLKRKVTDSMPTKDTSVLDTFSITEAERMIDERNYDYERRLKNWWEKLSKTDKQKALKEDSDLSFYINKKNLKFKL